MKKKLSNSIKLFCFGFGLSAQYLARLINKKNIEFELSGTSRSKINFKDKFIHQFYFEDDHFDKNIFSDLQNATHVLISTPPQLEKKIIHYFFDTLKNNKNLQWLGYLSSTSVYGNHQGEWVNENSNTNPTSTMGIKRLEAEKLLLETNLPVRIFRLSGIYSKERNVLQRLQLNQVKIPKSNNQLFSRIHVEDIAEALFLSFTNSKKNEIYNISDDHPCAYKEVIEYAAHLLKITQLEEISIDEMQNGPGREFFQDSKKVSNDKIKKIGLVLKYPNYKEGLQSIFKQSK